MKLKQGDIIRIALLIAVIFLIVIMLRNIEEVKFLSHDQCAYCMQKTGATCFNPTYLVDLDDRAKAPIKPTLNETKDALHTLNISLS